MIEIYHFIKISPTLVSGNKGEKHQDFSNFAPTNLPETLREE